MYLLAQRDGMLVKIFFPLDMVTTNGCYVVYLFFFYGCISFFCLENDFLDFYGRIQPILISPEQDFCMCTYLAKRWDVGEDFIFPFQIWLPCM